MTIGAYPAATVANYTQTLSLKASSTNVSAACLTGALFGCRCVSPSSNCNGAFSQSGRRVAFDFSNASGSTTYAQAICGLAEGIANTFLVESAISNGSNIASCPAGSVLISCGCFSDCDTTVVTLIFGENRADILHNKRISCSESVVQ